MRAASSFKTPAAELREVWSTLKQNFVGWKGRLQLSSPRWPRLQQMEVQVIVSVLNYLVGSRGA
eukprot:12902810-Prorocentrum_lima.AAC.1